MGSGATDVAVPRAQFRSTLERSAGARIWTIWSSAKPALATDGNEHSSQQIQLSWPVGTVLYFDNGAESCKYVVEDSSYCFCLLDATEVECETTTIDEEFPTDDPLTTEEFFAKMNPQAH